MQIQGKLKSLFVAIVAMFSVVSVVANDLPAGYTRLEYIESQYKGGWQCSYINTGYHVNPRSIIECEVNISPDQLDGWACPFGMHCDETERSCATVFVRERRNRVTGIATSTEKTFEWSSHCIPEGSRERLTFDCSKAELRYGNGWRMTNPGVTEISEQPLYIFARPDCYFCKMKLYSFRIREGEKIIRDFVPCKDSQGGIGLYDLANGGTNKVFYGSVVTAVPFIAGPEIKSHYTADELAYMPATKLLDLFKLCIVKPSDVLLAQSNRVAMTNGVYKNNRDYSDPKQEDYIDRLDVFNSNCVNAITFDCFTNVMGKAKEADEWYLRASTNEQLAIDFIKTNALLGITVGMKDDFDTQGWVKDGASLAAYAIGITKPAAADDDVCARLRAAGAIFPFQTTVPECCVTCTTWSRLYGVTHNPWNLHYSVGGSSGGSGAALAAGFCTLATGTDMGGSIRIPAAMNGVFGFKPPFGRVPGSENTFCANGPMARTFEDMVLMQNVICGPSEKIHSTVAPKLDYAVEYEPIKGETVAVCRLQNWLSGGLDASVSNSMDKVAAALSKAGANVIEVTLPSATTNMIPTFLRGLLASDLGSMVPLCMAYTNLLCRYTYDTFKGYGDVGPTNAFAASKLMTQIHVEMQTNVFKRGCLAMVMPTLPTPYMPADIGVSDDEDKMSLVNNERIGAMQMLTTSFWNLDSRFPVVNVPVMLSDKDARVPLGVQVVGNTYDDLTAFRVAKALADNLEDAKKFYVTEFPTFTNYVHEAKSPISKK